MNIKLFFALFFIFLTPMATAFSVSPATFEADLENLSIDLYVINTSDEPISLDVIVQGFLSNEYILSRDQVDLSPKSSDSVNITFLENVYREGSVCFLLGGEGLVGQAVKVCIAANVATTPDGLPTDQEPVVTEEIIDSIINAKQGSLDVTRNSIGFAEASCVDVSDYEQAEPVLLQAEKKIEEADQAKRTGDLEKASQLLDEADDLIAQAKSFLPAINLAAEETISYPFDRENIEKLFSEMDLDDSTLAENALTVMEQLTVSRNIKLFKLQDKQTNEISFQTKVTNIITNLTREPLDKLKLVDVIPKVIAPRNSNIKSEENFRKIREHPLILEWNITLESRGNDSIYYCIDNEVPEENFSLFNNPIVLTRTIPELESVACVNNLDCDDRNPCTTDLCSAAKCSNAPLPDGTTCGKKKICQQGVCSEGEGPPLPVMIPEEVPIVYVLIGIIILLIILFIAYYLSKKKKDQGQQQPQAPAQQTAQVTQQPPQTPQTPPNTTAIPKSAGIEVFWILRNIY